ncbi:MAG: ABC transporter ATP-binding protein [Elusimicrobiota bacterium]
MNLLEVRNMSLKLNGSKILNDINLDIYRGKVHAIVGPNGAGKSTLAYAVMGLEGYKDIQGNIYFDGQEITDLKVDERARKGITLTWQEPARYEGLKVSDFISSAAEDKGRKSIEKVLERMGLNCDYYYNRALDESLSGGERKKIELASVLAMNTRLVMMDEPDSGIDVESLEKIFESIKFMKKKGITVVLITHSLAVLKQADRAFLMCHGNILDRGKAEKIFPYFEKKCIPCPHKNVPDKKEF